VVGLIVLSMFIAKKTTAIRELNADITSAGLNKNEIASLTVKGQLAVIPIRPAFANQN
jgi:hypothetical protein